MDTTKKYNNPNPQNKANLLSKIFFWWLMPLVSYGRRNTLDLRDIYNARNSEKSEYWTDKLERNWKEVCREADKKKIKPSLLTAIRKTFVKSYAIGGMIYITKVVIYTYGMPTALASFINHFSEEPRDKMRGYYLGMLIVVISFLNCVGNHHTRLYDARIGLRVKVACGALVYRKILRLNKLSLDNTDVGKVINLLSNDLIRFDTAADYINHVWIMPIIAVIGTLVMYGQVGSSAFVGVGTMLVQAVLLQGYLSRLQGRLRFKIAVRTDRRVKLMNEITTGIKVIKMYAWEKPFEKIVSALRGEEIKRITHTAYIQSLSVAIQLFTERVTLYIIIVIYVLLGNELTGAVVFSVSQVITSLLLNVCILFPLGLTAAAEVKTTIFRLEEFLLKEEREETPKIVESVTKDTGLVNLDHVYASWTTQTISPTLSNVSFELPPGSLCCVVGSVGAGKSSILHLLLRELPLTSGTLRVNGKISYASQEPWVFASNIRNNILFGQPYEQEKYHSVVSACALERDFELFPFGDKTHVGDKGASLSGGQKARINLARAVYREADIYLLDDPLSAVDPHVAKHLMNKCINEYLSNKTRILVTHQAQFLEQADFVLILDNGKTENFIKSSELSDTDLIGPLSVSIETPITSKTLQEKTDTDVPRMSVDSAMEDEIDESQERQELIEKGSIGLNIYKRYFQSGATLKFLSIEIFLLIIAQIFCNCCDLWVTFWTNNIALSRSNANISISLLTSEFNSTEYPENATTMTTSMTTMTTYSMNTMESEDFRITTPPGNSSFNMFSILNRAHLTQDFYIKVHTFLIVLAISLTILRSGVFFRICMSASKKLHNLMFSNILHAKMRFFDTNPSGRILNRFSNDMGIIDEKLPISTLMTLQTVGIATGIMVMVFIKSIYMIIPAVILGLIIERIRGFFLTTAQNIKRLESVAKAPVFSYVTTSLNGLQTIRASNAEDMVKREFDDIQDGHTAAFYMFIHTFQAFGFYLDMTSVVFLAIIIVQFLLSPNALSGDVGLVLSQCLIVVVMIQLATRSLAEVANNMTSVERLFQYTKLDNEGPFESLPVNKPSLKWPEAGRIRFKNVYLKYVIDEEPVLKNLNFEIQPGEKIGIVGRTGAGKSSLISALFRLARIDGVIEIDGTDVEKVGLTELRSKISIIPQEPTLFSESIGYNLDPFRRYDDETLWKALESVELKKVIESLDMVVTEGGSNFSVGQRQLICLARAIVRNNRILVMDEATANVDPYTDDLIQQSIRKNFKSCTVLTVAHRINTIIDNDKVIVMDAGQILEFAPPYELLQDSETSFSSMVRETGNEDILRKKAEHHYNKYINI